MKRYMSYFAAMLLVLSITDLCLGGTLFNFGTQGTYELSTKISGLGDSKSKQIEQKEILEEDLTALGKLIDSKSCGFVKAAFNRNWDEVVCMLSTDAEYLVSRNNSSYIRYTSGEINVEGYMATDRKLNEVRQNWYVIEDDGTITSRVEVDIEGEKASQIWYIHYIKCSGQWKIYMLENGV